MRLNKLSEAEHWYRESLRSKPDHIPAHLTYGKLLAVTVSLVIFFSSSSSPFPVLFGLLCSLFPAVSSSPAVSPTLGACSLERKNQPVSTPNQWLVCVCARLCLCVHVQACVCESYWVSEGAPSS